MSFMTYSLKLYEDTVNNFDSMTSPTKDDVYLAKQYLKFIDDLVDEGYNTLKNTMEEDFQGYSRLKTFILNKGEKPFIIEKFQEFADENFGETSFELNEYISNLIDICNNVRPSKDYPFINEMIDYSNWLKKDYNNDTSFVFLLRDTLVPYISFMKDKNINKDNIHAFLIGRKFMDIVGEKPYLDEIVRGAINNALEEGICDYNKLIEYCKPYFKKFLDDYPEVKNALDDLFTDIKSEKIIIVESGIYATFPLLLTALDKNIEIRLFATAPFLYEVYKDFCFCNAYEKIREFETVICQDKLFNLTSFKDKKFYVTESQNQHINNRSLEELAYAMSVLNRDA